MSESIKQNYNDIQNVTTEVDRIKRVIDALYDQFTGTQKLPSKRASDKHRTKVIGWTIGTIGVFALIISFVLGAVFFTNQNETPSVTVPTTNVNPSTNRPNLAPLTPANYERGMLLELYHSLQLVNKALQNLTGPHCDWPGISCNATTGRVISIKINTLMGDFQRRSGMPATIPAIIGNFAELQFLDLSFSNLTATIPASITNLKQLFHLRLTSNPHLTGTLPELAALPTLKELFLFGTSLSVNESSLTMLMNLPAIETLSLRDLAIRSQLPATMSSSLKNLLLTGCRLHGTIPKSWEDSNVQYLDISDNRLNGSIPCLGKKIHSLYADHNQFTGEFCGDNYRQIEVMFLMNMNLTGVFDLPNADISQMSALFVHDNQFTSFMPSSQPDEDQGPLQCSAVNNPLKCPIPDWTKKLCSAKCT